MIAHPHALDVRPDRLDHARALVPEHGRTAGRRRPVDRVPVRVADTARLESHEHLAGVGWCELQLGDLELAADLVEHGSPDDHPRTGTSPLVWDARSSSIGM